MGNYYRHLQLVDCIVIYELFFKGYTINEIANVVGFHKTTLYQELYRNSSQINLIK